MPHWCERLQQQRALGRRQRAAARVPARRLESQQQTQPIAPLSVVVVFICESRASLLPAARPGAPACLLGPRRAMAGQEQIDTGDPWLPKASSGAAAAPSAAPEAALSLAALFAAILPLSCFQSRCRSSRPAAPGPGQPAPPPPAAAAAACSRR